MQDIPAWNVGVGTVARKLHQLQTVLCDFVVCEKRNWKVNFTWQEMEDSTAGTKLHHAG